MYNFCTNVRKVEIFNMFFTQYMVKIYKGASNVKIAQIVEKATFDICFYENFFKTFCRPMWMPT